MSENRPETDLDLLEKVAQESYSALASLPGKRLPAVDIEDLRLKHPDTQAELVFVSSQKDFWKTLSVKDLQQYYRDTGFGCMDDPKCHHVEYVWGCTNGCIYCYRIGYVHPIKPSKVMDEPIDPEKIRASAKALAEKDCQRYQKGVGDRCPGEVHMCISTDAMQHKEIIQEVALITARSLLENAELVSMVSKGVPYGESRRVEWKQLFARYGKLVFWQTTCASMDAEVQALWEPGAPPPEERMLWLESVLETDANASCRINPLIPGQNDDPEHVAAVLRRLASMKKKPARVAIGYMYGSVPIFYNIKRTTGIDFNPRPSQRKPAIRYFEDTPTPLAGGSPKYHVKKELRRKTYNMAIALGKQLGLDVKVCWCDNSDLPEYMDHRCGISARSGWPQVSRMNAEELKKYVHGS